MQPWAWAAPYCSVWAIVHPFGVTKSSISFGNVTSAGWKVTLCDPIWHVSSHCSEAILCLLTFYFHLFFSYVQQVMQFYQLVTCPICWIVLVNILEWDSIYLCHITTCYPCSLLCLCICWSRAGVVQKRLN